MVKAGIPVAILLHVLSFFCAKLAVSHFRKAALLLCHALRGAEACRENSIWRETGGLIIADPAGTGPGASRAGLEALGVVRRCLLCHL